MKHFDKIGFGTWLFGGTKEPNPNNDDAFDIACIKNAIDIGLRHIDTAENYAAGKCEELVGAAIKDYKREDLFIASKVMPIHLSYDDVINSCEQSLKRLGLDYLDLYYIHAPNPEIPITETARAFNELYKRGLIKNIGISNATIETMQKYADALDYPIFAAQNHYNLIAREPQRNGVLEYCRDNNIHFVAYRPITARLPELGIDSFYVRGIYPILDKMADKYGKTNTQIAVRWLIQQDNINILFQSTKAEHIKEVLGANDFELSDEDMRDLTDNFPKQQDVSFNGAGFFPMR